MTAMAFRAIAEAKGEVLIEKLRKATASKKEAKAGTVEMLTIDYYNGETTFFEWFTGATRMLYTKQGNPKHILIVAHKIVTKSAPDIKTKLITTSTSILTAGKKAAAVLPTLYDEQWYMALRHDPKDERLPMRRIMVFSATGDNFAKSTLRVPAEIDITDKGLYQQITEYVTF
jgi:hypothetical protein